MPFIESPELKIFRERFNVARERLSRIQIPDSGKCFTFEEIGLILDCIKGGEIVSGEWEHEGPEAMEFLEGYVSRYEAWAA